MMQAGYILAGLVLVLMAWFALPFLKRKVEERRLEKLCHARKAIVLTYDDGPGEELTARMLDLLGARQVKATFFALGGNVRLRPALAARIVAEGHDLGSHTHNHSNAWKTLPWTAAIDVDNGVKAINQAGGRGTFFRAPFGKLTLASLVHGALAGLDYAWWTIDSRDSWARRDIADVEREITAKGGGVLLMHDFDHYAKAPAQPSHAEHVLDLTRRIIDLAQQRGFKIMPLSVLLK